jgi:hypothetical protein
MRFQVCGNIRRSHGRPSPHGIRGGIGQLLDKEKRNIRGSSFMARCVKKSDLPCRITHIGGRSTFSPAIVSSNSNGRTRKWRTPSSPQDQVVLQWLKLFLHCVGGICKVGWRRGKNPMLKVLRVPRPRDRSGKIGGCNFYTHSLFYTLFSSYFLLIHEFFEDDQAYLTSAQSPMDQIRNEEIRKVSNSRNIQQGYIYWDTGFIAWCNSTNQS